METTIIQHKVCTLCRGPADLNCQRCWDPYCSSRCQKTDWPQHKLTCFPMPCLVKSTPDHQPVSETRAVQIQDSASSLRPPNPTSTLQQPKLSADSNGEIKKINSNSSLFDNQFKRNSKNLGFQSNNVTNGNVKAVSLDKSSMPDKSSLPDKNSMPEKSSMPDKSSIPDKPINHSSKDPIRKPGTNQIKVKTEPTRVANANTVPSKKDDSTSATSIEVPVTPKSEPIEAPLRAPSKVTIDPKPPTQTLLKEEDSRATIKVNPKPKIEPVETPMRLPGKAAIKGLLSFTPELIDNDSTATNHTEVTAKAKPEEVEHQPKSNISKTEPWMKPFPIEEKEFVSVLVQYVADDNKIWVMVEKNEVASNNLLREINKGIVSAPTPDQKEVKVNTLFRVPFEEVYYRGVIVEPVTAAGTVSARLIDYGNEVSVPINKLKSAIPVMVNLNAFSFPIKFQKPRKTEICDKLNIKIQSMKGDVMTVIVEGDDQIFTMNDIEVVPIPVGKKLYCLDFSNLMDGYISACVFDTKAIAHTDKICAKISDYCSGSKEAYTPQVDELCLTKFEDGQWYRAVVLKMVSAKNFEILFIDYGNTTTASNADIRKMPQEFLHHCLTNKCYIKDFPKNPSKPEIRKMAMFFNANQVFEVDTVEMENEAYLIKPKI